MIELNEIFINNGLKDEALMQELDIIDECISPKYLTKDHKLPEQIKIKMNHHINEVVEKIKTLKNIPQLSEINLRLSFYLFRTNRINESKKYLNRFENGPMSIKHYANWLNKYYRILKEACNS